MSTITENYKEVRERIDEACRKVGRKPEEVTLIAVSKTHPAEYVEELLPLGVVDFGENKAQELCAKQDEVQEWCAGQDEAQQAAQKPLRWHLIGHLQRNKVKQVVGRAYMIHSVDSLRLAQEIEKEAGKAGITAQILVEINIGAEESKSGTTPEEAPELIRAISQMEHVHVNGLMCIAPIVEKPEDARPYFARMRALREEIAAMDLPNVEMRELSMGMTGDFEAAVAEGATFVRVGTAIFGHRDYGTAQ